MADASFQQEVLTYHNVCRSKHSTPPLTLNDELNASAQKWAEHLLETKKLKHSDTENGENIFFISTKNSNLSGKEAVETWYNEIGNYDWSNPGFNSTTSHYTQVVWKETTELGVGMATDGKMVYVVGQYRPPGNVMDNFETNVLPLVPSFQLEFLDAHNEYRAKHNTPPVMLSMELNASAQKWAKHMVDTRGVEHSHDGDNGENIYFMHSYKPITEPVKVSDAVNSWYSEVSGYDWSNPNASFHSSNFSQVVWKETTEVGVGMATGQFMVAVVGHYRPRGNMIGAHKENVLPLAAIEQQ